MTIRQQRLYGSGQLHFELEWRSLPLTQTGGLSRFADIVQPASFAHPRTLCNINFIFALLAINCIYNQKTMRGRTINIFIPDGNPRSIKACDIKDSIVKAIFVPRSKIEDIYKRPDVQEPGLYFLFGSEDEIGKPRVYVGEAENLLTRLKQHNAGKDFWNTAICFVSEKHNINKAHIKFLESHCCEQAKQIGKCILENNTSPTQSSLTEQDVDFVLSFFDDLKILIATLGFPIFEESKKEKQNTIFCSGKEASAQGEYVEDGLIVFAGSIAQPDETNTISPGVSNTRKALLEKEILKAENDVLVFKENYTFNSPSTAAAVILGRRANGWIEWKDKNGQTLTDKYRQK